MKIKEKGLTGQKAQSRRESMADSSGGRKGFNAFKEMSKTSKKEEKEKPEVYLDFLGSRIRVYEGEDGRGTIKDDEVPTVKGVTLRFDGCGGDCSFDAIKVRPKLSCETS
jgi:lupus La protein